MKCNMKDDSRSCLELILIMTGAFDDLDGSFTIARLYRHDFESDRLYQ